MNAARIRAMVIVGVLLVAAVVLVKITISDDKQSHASYTSSCPEGTIAVVTDPLPNYPQINLKIYNASAVPGQAGSVASELTTRGFKVAKVGPHDDKPTTASVVDITYGPSTVGAAWVVRAEFLLNASDPLNMSGMHFSVTNKSNVVTVVIGTNFKQLGAKSEVNQAIAALKTPPAPAGTCADNP